MEEKTKITISFKIKLKINHVNSNGEIVVASILNPIEVSF